MKYGCTQIFTVCEKKLKKVQRKEKPRRTVVRLDRAGFMCLRGKLITLS